jgi:hypothetical protein
VCLGRQPWLPTYWGRTLAAERYHWRGCQSPANPLQPPQRVSRRQRWLPYLRAMPWLPTRLTASALARVQPNAELSQRLASAWRRLLRWSSAHAARRPTKKISRHFNGAVPLQPRLPATSALRHVQAVAAELGLGFSSSGTDIGAVLCAQHRQLLTARMTVSRSS